MRPRPHGKARNHQKRAERYAAYTPPKEVVRLKRAVRCEGVNVGINLGAVAGAGIAEHLHVHIVPRWRGDMNFLPVVADLRVMPEALDATWSRLVPYFRPLGDSPPEAPAPRRRAPKKGAPGR